jgi:valyl-tRNA synthetase
MSVLVRIMDPKVEDFKILLLNDLVTGPDIFVFWVARMIIAGYGIYR